MWVRMVGGEGDQVKAASLRLPLDWDDGVPLEAVILACQDVSDLHKLDGFLQGPETLKTLIRFVTRPNELLDRLETRASEIVDSDSRFAEGITPESLQKVPRIVEDILGSASIGAILQRVVTDDALLNELWVCCVRNPHCRLRLDGDEERDNVTAFSQRLVWALHECCNNEFRNALHQHPCRVVDLLNILHRRPIVDVFRSVLLVGRCQKPVVRPDILCACLIGRLWGCTAALRGNLGDRSLLSPLEHLDGWDFVDLHSNAALLIKELVQTIGNNSSSNNRCGTMVLRTITSRPVIECLFYAISAALIPRTADLGEEDEDFPLVTEAAAMELPAKRAASSRVDRRLIAVRGVLETSLDLLSYISIVSQQLASADCFAKAENSSSILGSVVERMPLSSGTLTEGRSESPPEDEDEDDEQEAECIRDFAWEAAIRQVLRLRADASVLVDVDTMPCDKFTIPTDLVDTTIVPQFSVVSFLIQRYADRLRLLRQAKGVEPNDCGSGDDTDVPTEPMAPAATPGSSSSEEPTTAPLLEALKLTKVVAREANQPQSIFAVELLQALVDLLYKSNNNLVHISVTEILQLILDPRFASLHDSEKDEKNYEWTSGVANLLLEDTNLLQQATEAVLEMNLLASATSFDDRRGAAMRGPPQGFHALHLLQLISERTDNASIVWPRQWETAQKIMSGFANLLRAPLGGVVPPGFSLSAEQRRSILPLGLCASTDEWLRTRARIEEQPWSQFNFSEWATSNVFTRLDQGAEMEKNVPKDAWCFANDGFSSSQEDGDETACEEPCEKISKAADATIEYTSVAETSLSGVNKIMEDEEEDNKEHSNIESIFDFGPPGKGLD